MVMNDRKNLINIFYNIHFEANCSCKFFDLKKNKLLKICLKTKLLRNSLELILVLSKNKSPEDN